MRLWRKVHFSRTRFFCAIARVGVVSWSRAFARLQRATCQVIDFLRLMGSAGSRDRQRQKRQSLCYLRDFANTFCFTFFTTATKYPSNQYQFACN
jgi:hypothetical protein